MTAAFFQRTYAPAIALCLLLSSAFAQTDDGAQDGGTEGCSPTFQRLYVNPEDIIVTRNGVFHMSADGGLCPVQSLGSDDQGLYAEMDEELPDQQIAFS